MIKDDLTQMIKDDLHITSSNKLPVGNKKEMSSTKAVELQRQQKCKKELYNTESISKSYQPEITERRRARRER